MVRIKQMRMHQLECNVALQSRVTRAINDAHAALTERLDDVVRSQSTAGTDRHSTHARGEWGGATRGL
jgi:hypothetical protein